MQAALLIVDPPPPAQLAAAFTFSVQPVQVAEQFRLVRVLYPHVLVPQDGLVYVQSAIPHVRSSEDPVHEATQEDDTFVIVPHVFAVAQFLVRFVLVTHDPPHAET